MLRSRVDLRGLSPRQSWARRLWTGDLPPIAGGANWGFVQANSTFNGTATQTQSIALVSAPTAGNTLIAVVMASASVLTYSNPRDTYTNAWTSLGTFSETTTTHTYGVWATICGAGSGADTFSVTSSVAAGSDTVIFELAGGRGSILQDGSMLNGSVASGTTITTPAFTALAGDVLINAAVGTGTVSFGAPWTNAQVNSNGNGAAIYMNVPAGTVNPNVSDTSAGSRTDVVVGLQGGALALPSAPFIPRGLPIGV